MPKGIRLEQLGAVPEPSYKLPSNELYIQLGCAGCTSQVCIKAVGATSLWPEASTNTADARDLIELTREVEKGEQFVQGTSSTWTESCGITGTCPNQKTIETVVELLNERFGAELKMPEAEASS